MNLLTVLEIIARIVSGVVFIGFFVGLFFHDNHKVFEKIWLYSGFIAIAVGLSHLLIYTVMGGL